MTCWPKVKWFKVNFLWIFLLLLPGPPAWPEILERIAAVVNDRIIFLTDIERHLTLFQPDAIAGEDSLEKTLHALIDLRLLEIEAERFGSARPTQEEVDAAFQLIRKRFPDAMAFQRTLSRYATTPEGLREEIEMRLGVERFIDERIRFFIFVTPDDVEIYYREHQRQFEGKTLEAVKDQIEKQITEERAQTRLKDYLERLRSRAKIRINL